MDHQAKAGWNGNSVGFTETVMSVDSVYFPCAFAATQCIERSRAISLCLKTVAKRDQQQQRSASMKKPYNCSTVATERMKYASSLHSTLLQALKQYAKIMTFTIFTWRLNFLAKFSTDCFALLNKQTRPRAETRLCSVSSLAYCTTEVADQLQKQYTVLRLLKQNKNNVYYLTRISWSDNKRGR